MAIPRYQRYSFRKTVEATGGKCLFEELGDFWMRDVIITAIIEEFAGADVTDRAIEAAAHHRKLMIVLVQAKTPMTDRRLDLLCALADLPGLTSVQLLGECGSEKQIARRRVALKDGVNLRVTNFKNVVFDQQLFKDEVDRLSGRPWGIPETKVVPRADDGAEVPPQVATALQGLVAEKSKALRDAKVTVHRAYFYHGPTAVTPVGAAKTIAVDVTFGDYTDSFDLWDVEFMDGQSGVSYGSDADIAFLNVAGEFHSYDSDDVDFTRPIRLLLIGAVSPETTSVNLSYWGQDLTKDATRLEANGMDLPRRE